MKFLVTVAFLFLLVINVCFTAHYGEHCSAEQKSEEQCEQSQTCCSRTLTTFDSEGNEIIKEVSTGCCSYKDGVCCSETDGCCPNGYTCDSKNRKCLKQPSQVEPLLVSCPDFSICSSGQTCCPVSAFAYGCCSYDNAVCCSNNQGCCPRGYVCEQTSCRTLYEIIPMGGLVESKNQSLISRSVEEVVDIAPLSKREWDGQYTVCPDKSQCLHGHTCCKLDDTSRLTTPYACCPYYQAVCCQKSNYCCPQNRPCDPTTNQCITTTSKKDEVEYTPAYKMD